MILSGIMASQSSYSAASVVNFETNTDTACHLQALKVLVRVCGIAASAAPMKAAVIYEAGGPEVLKLESRPICRPQEGQVLIQVKAFGLNRSELFTRQGHSPGVPFPRILGIEAVGIVEEAPGGEFSKGQRVATAMGGLGRKIDGGYAEYTCVPAMQVQACRLCLQAVLNPSDPARQMYARPACSF